MGWEAAAYLTVNSMCLIFAVVLIFYREFENRIIGRLGLFFVILSNTAVLHDMYQSGEAFAVSRTTLVFTLGIALFLLALVVGHLRWWSKAKTSPMRRNTDQMRLFW